MEIYKNLAKRYLIQNKKRTITSIIAIVIVTILLSSILLLFHVYQEYMISIERDSNNWEARFENIPYGKIYALKENSDIKQVAVVQTIGVSAENYWKETNEQHIILKAYNETAMQNLKIQLINGRLPNNINEIVVSSNLIDLGEKINITINDIQKEYQIVGIMQPPSFEKISFQYSEIAAITCLGENLNDTDIVDASIVYQNIHDTYVYTEQIADVLKLYENDAKKQDNIQYNEDLLHYSNIWNMNSEEDLKIIGMTGCIVVLIVVISIVIIYSIFNLSVEERKKEFANLHSIGATKKQISSIIFWEATILLLIAIPFGILLSILLITITINYINLVTESSLILSIPYLKLLFAILLTVITTYVAILKPAIKASKVSIIEELRGVKTSKKMKKHTFQENSAEILLAYRFRKQNKSRYASMIITISISIFLFLFTQGYILNHFHGLIKTSFNGNIDILKRDYFEEVEEAVKNTDGILEAVGYSYISGYITLPKEMLNSSLQQVINQGLEINNGLSENEFNCQIYALSSESQNNLLKQLGLHKLEDGQCILFNCSPTELRGLKGIPMTNYQEKDKITFYQYSKNTTIGPNINEILNSSADIIQSSTEVIRR